jgi:hypothetical protein
MKILKKILTYAELSTPIFDQAKGAVALLTTQNYALTANIHLIEHEPCLILMKRNILSFLGRIRCLLLGTHTLYLDLNVG